VYFAGFLTVLATLASPVASRAADGIVINLTYDSITGMVRPEVHPGVAVHHDLTIALSGRNQVSKSRSRNTKNLSDSNSASQVLSSSDKRSSYSSWQVAPVNRFVRIQRDPQKLKRLSSDGGCCCQVN
jgi:hypothetical protein